MKKMSKILALAVAAMLCFTAMPTAFAEVAEPFEIYNDVPTLAASPATTVSDVTNAFGLNNNVTYKKSIIPAGTGTPLGYTGYASFVNSDATWTSLKDYQYLVFSANFAKEENIKYMSLQTVQSGMVGNMIDITGIKSNRWNNATFVCTINKEATAADTTTYKLFMSKIETYINGTLVDTKTGSPAFRDSSKNSDGPDLRTDIRIGFMKELTKPEYTTPVDAAVYNGKTHIYATNNAPVLPEMPRLAEFNGKLIAGSSTLVGDIAHDDTISVSAYTDDTFSTPLAADASLSQDAVVVAQKGETIIYYDEFVDSTSVIDVPALFPTSTGTASEIDGGFAKPASDKANKLLINPESPRTYQLLNAETQYTAQELKHFNYIVVRTTMATDENINSIYLQTTSSITVGSSVLSSNWTPNRWNDVMFVAKIDSATTGEGNELYVSQVDTYINGENVSEYTGSTKFRVTSPLLDMRIAFDKTPNIKNVNNASTYVALDTADKFEASIYTDGISWCACENYPSITVMPTITNASGNVINATDTTTLADMQHSEDVSVRAYSDDTFTSQLTAGDVFTSNTIVVAEKDGLLNYYTVAGSTYNFRTGTVADVMNANIQMTADSVSGICGRSEGATEFTVLPNLKGLWGLATEPKMTMRYFVCEFDSLSAGLDYIYFTSSQSAPLSSAIVQNNAEWDKITYVFDIQDKISYSYIDGKLVDTYEATSGQALSLYDGTGTNNVFRVVFSNSDNSEATKVYLDNMNFYFSKNMPSVAESTKHTIDEGIKSGVIGNYLLSGNTIHIGSHNVTASALQSEFTSEITPVVIDASTLKELDDYTTALGKAYVVFNNNGVYTTYTLNSDANVLAKITDANGNVSVAAYAEDGAKLITAQYENEALTDVVTKSVPADTFTLSDLTVNSEYTKRAGFMLWKNVTDLNPLKTDINFVNIQEEE